MRTWIARIIPALRLARVSVAFAAVANVWFVILWTRASANEPGTAALKPDSAHARGLGASPWVGSIADDSTWSLVILLLGSAANALGLFAFATTFNDLLDWRRDRSTNPDRPIPAGRLSVDQAATLVAASFGVAVLGATVLGMTSVLLTIVVGGAILFFNALGKYVPAVGLVVLGLIYAGQMVVPNLGLRFVWPVWLVMTHALAVGTIVHIVGRKTPTVSARAAITACTGWLFWTLIILGVGYWRSAPAMPVNPASTSVRAAAAAGSAATGSAAADRAAERSADRAAERAREEGGDSGRASNTSTSSGAPSSSSESADPSRADATPREPRDATRGGDAALSTPAAPSQPVSKADMRRSLWPAWVDPWAALWVFLLVLAFAMLVWRRIRSLGMNQRSGEKIARYGALWLAFYACAWCASQKFWTEATILAVLAGAGLLGMTLLREVIALIEHPVGYRRE